MNTLAPLYEWSTSASWLSWRYFLQFFTGALLYTLKWWVLQKKVTEAQLLEELTALLRAF